MEYRFVMPLMNCFHLWCYHASCITSHELYSFVIFSWISVFVIPLMNSIYLWMFSWITVFVISLVCIYFLCSRWVFLLNCDISHELFLFLIVSWIIFIWYIPWTVFICDGLIEYCFCETSHELYLFMMVSHSFVFVIPLMNCIYLWWSHRLLFVRYFSWTVFICDVLMHHCFCDTSHELYWFVMFSLIIVFMIHLMNCIHVRFSHAALFFFVIPLIWEVICITSLLSWTLFICDVLMHHCFCDTYHQLYLFVMVSYSIVFVIPLINSIYWWCSHATLFLWYLSWTVFMADVLM